MKARPSRASAAASAVLGSALEDLTTDRRSPPARLSRAASGQHIGHGRRFTPRARRRRWRLCWRPVAAPLAVRQHGVGVGLLLEHEAPVPPALGAPAHPVEDPELAQPRQRRGDGAHADDRLAGDRLVGRIEPAGGVVQEVEDQRVQHLQRRWGRRRRHAGPAGACRGRSRGPGARGARRPSSASAGSGRSVSCCPTTPARGHRSAAGGGRAGAVASGRASCGEPAAGKVSRSAGRAPPASPEARLDQGAQGHPGQRFAEPLGSSSTCWLMQQERVAAEHDRQQPGGRARRGCGMGAVMGLDGGDDGVSMAGRTGMARVFLGCAKAARRQGAGTSIPTARNRCSCETGLSWGRLSCQAHRVSPASAGCSWPALTGGLRHFWGSGFGRLLAAHRKSARWSVSLHSAPASLEVVPRVGGNLLRR